MARPVIMFLLCLLLSVAIGRTACADSLWRHNGSTVILRETGSDVSILYETPSRLMLRSGVKRGTVLFTGRRDGDFLFGKARRFSSRCPGTYDYNVAGQWYGRDRLILWGMSQRRGEGCVLGQTFSEQLDFNLHSRSVQASNTAPLRDIPDEMNQKVTETVLSCYRNGTLGDGSISITEMRICAGAWVTPRILLQCAMGAYCSVIGDSPADRETLYAELENSGLDVNTALMLPSKAETLPPLPDRPTIDSCRQSSQDEAAFLECVVRKSNNGKYDALLTCLQDAEATRHPKCLTEAADNGNFTYLAGCAKGHVPSASELVDCIPNEDVKALAHNMSDCVSSAGGRSDEQIACLSRGLPEADVAALDCVTDPKDPAQLIECLIASKRSAQATIANLVASCVIGEDRSALECASASATGSTKSLLECFELDRLDKRYCIRRESSNIGGNLAERAACVSSADDDLQLALCFGEDAGPEFSRLAKCAKEEDQTRAALCLLGDSKEARAVQQYYQCIEEGSDVADLLSNCTDGIVDGKTGQALSCVIRAEGDTGKLAACAAGAALPPEAAKLIGCAASSQGATDFLLCSAGPAMNAEWRIAAECAVNSGGVPVTFAACTAGRLTVRELTKCFKGDCFGPNNTIVVGITNALRDLTEGPGENHEVVKAIRNLKELTGGDNSVVNNPGQILGGSNSVFRNPSQIWGGENSVFNQAVGGKNSEVRKIMRVVDPSNW